MFYAVRPPKVPLRFNSVYAIRQMSTDSSDPAAVARPMGSSVCGNSFDMKYAPGTRTSTMAVILWIKDSSDLPIAQK